MAALLSRILPLLFVCLALSAWPLSAGHAQGTCSPPALGHPCSTGGVASQGAAEPGLSLGVGNPVNLATGNKHQYEVDLPAHPQAPLLQVARHYNSLDPRHGMFGRGWSSTYDTRLHYAGGRYQIVQADGSRIDFAPSGRGPLRNGHGLLQAEADHWIWIWPDGRRLRFDAQGRLIRIVAPRGSAHLGRQASAPTTNAHAIHGASNRPQRRALDAPAAVDIVRHTEHGPLRGNISRLVATEGGRVRAALNFHYHIHAGRAYVSAVDTPLGRFTYRYEPSPEEAGAAALRLTTVRRPDGYERRYLYEAHRQSGMPHLVTGIALASPEGSFLRTDSWSYDAQGRAIASEKHYPGHSAYALRISYVRAASARSEGLTVVQSANGRQTRFEFGLHAGRLRLLQVSGAPCPGCAAPGSAAAYDEHGRLRRLNSARILRYATGEVRRFTPDAPGWPGLSFDFDTLGRRQAWRTPQSGTETTSFDDHGRPVLRRFANGDAWRYQYDEAGRPIRITARNRQAALITRLSWEGNRLASIRHPHENESRRYDALGRLIERHVRRPFAPASATAPAAGYVERFEYDGHDRLIAHHLPEGGALVYDWSAQGRLMRIGWLDATGRRHEVIRAWHGEAGYRYGNGLALALHFRDGNARALAVHDQGTVYWDHFRVDDARGRPVREMDRFPTMPDQTLDWRYAYDSQSRLAVATGSAAQTVANPEYWHAWLPDGSAAALRVNGDTARPHIERDASGLPLRVDGFDLGYGPQRRLERLLRDGAVLAHYRHNAFGHRIEAHSAQEYVQYFYLGNRLVAESRQPLTAASRPEERLITRRYIHAGDAIVGMIDYSRKTPAGVLYAVHADLLGMPRMVTDARRRIRWLARTTPLGAARRAAGDLDLRLRLPGQIADSITGWHDNLLRTYHPRWGHYLEPDPLGPLPGTQERGYAGQQPRRYVDPLGLLLFAFDGTRQNARNRSNVWLFGQHYQDGPVFYHSGPGNPYYLDMDAMVAHTAPQTIETQWQHLLNALHTAPLRPDQPVPIDIIGYSRGAALARHFGNLIAQHVDHGLFSYADPLRGQVTACVDLRFMGLFDTVAQFGLGGALNTQYDFSISAAWSWVAHAVALHERRRLFPLLAAVNDMAENVVEAPFVGAHADIGGGVPLGGKPSDAAHGDLSDVALNWMLWQARAASVPLTGTAAEQAEVSHPILHDARPAWLRSVQDSDRRVDGPDGRKQYDYQDEHDRLGRAQRQATEALIARYEGWRGRDSSEVGTVDLEAYARWLHDELGWPATLAHYPAGHEKEAA